MALTEPCAGGAELGHYARADQFRNLPSQNLNGIIQRVSYPVLSNVENNQTTLRNSYSKLIKDSMFISFISMIWLAAVAKPLILVLIGEQWLPPVPYLQLLCFSGMLYPLHSLNLNILNVKGRSDLFLKLEVFKKGLMIPTIVIGVLWGGKNHDIGGDSKLHRCVFYQ